VIAQPTKPKEPKNEENMPKRKIEELTKISPRAARLRNPSGEEH